ncbi:PREDICTED: pleckstrin homology domain-containing family O member 2 [Gekko japonicus]|uniref:Pleckstrin homology domain-containing family O member 2 n=1 Tax=Gekko japonicus TaxID=146911 RepID=A0ABM1KJT5_GEKJA|nr:PREDICTED: pleckstrin homology domain-containing family O member 2 [Gekko japonicus]
MSAEASAAPGKDEAPLALSGPEPELFVRCYLARFGALRAGPDLSRAPEGESGRRRYKELHLVFDQLISETCGPAAGREAPEQPCRAGSRSAVQLRQRLVRAKGAVPPLHRGGGGSARGRALLGGSLKARIWGSLVTRAAAAQTLIPPRLGGGRKEEEGGGRLSSPSGRPGPARASPPPPPPPGPETTQPLFAAAEALGWRRSCFGAPGKVRPLRSIPRERRHVGGASARSLPGEEGEARGGAEAAARRRLKGESQLRSKQRTRFGGGSPEALEGGEPAPEEAADALWGGGGGGGTMEDGVKEELPEKPKCASTADKVGWIKKNSGGILGFWKERYILLCKSQLLMYEDEDQQKCVETVELENYEKCQDLRALLNRKHRFILIRSPGYKVQDIKFQAFRKEEKESWMKALNEGINRGKNRVFDEVKVDQSLSLEHVTRGRAKMGQGRRPPTRSHLKEVANSVSDGILRLDLDVPDSGPLNTTLVASDTINVSPPKEPIKPPMPPTKPLTEKLDPDPMSEDLDAKSPPMPPAKSVKETDEPSDSLSSAEGDGGTQAENAKETNVGSEVEHLVEAGEDTPKGPVPPPKLLSAMMKVSWDDPASELAVVNNGNLPAAGSKENLRDDAKEVARPPTPPPKILSKKLRASMNSKRESSEADTSEDDQRPDGSNSPVNGMNGEGVTEPPPEEPVFEHGEGELLFQEQRETSSAQEVNKESSSLPAKGQALLLESVGNSTSPKTRSSSMGDLLTELRGKPHPGQGLQKGAAPHVAQMEKKVAYERERTERLLQLVLSEQPPAGNGPPTNREALLSEAVEQLRQATQVLQESKGSEEPRKEPGEKVKGLPKDLATLYRRSAP